MSVMIFLNFKSAAAFPLPLSFSTWLWIDAFTRSRASQAGVNPRLILRFVLYICSLSFGRTWFSSVKLNFHSKCLDMLRTDLITIKNRCQGVNIHPPSPGFQNPGQACVPKFRECPSLHVLILDFKTNTRKTCFSKLQPKEYFWKVLPPSLPSSTG